MSGRAYIPPEHQWPWLTAVMVAAAVLAGWVLSRWPGDRHWPTTVLAYAPQFVWPVLPLVALAWAVATRCWPAAALDAVMLAVALLGPGGLGLGHAGEPADGDLRIASQNLFMQTTRAGDSLRERWRSCDIICLQETSEEGREGLLPGYDRCVLGELCTFVRGRIIGSVAISPDVPDIPSALACEVEIDGRRLVVLNVHVEMSRPEMSFPYVRRLWPDYLQHTVLIREVQFRAYREWFAAQELPVIVAGDFNTPPASRFYNDMRAAGLTDCFGAVGQGGGYTYVLHRIPVFRIDYVWSGAGVEPITCAVGPPGPSDHRMVIATVRLQPGA